MKGFSPTLPWYKTSAGKIFLFLLFLGFALLLSFGGLVVYYTYQITQGNASQIAEAIRSSRFTFGAGLQSTNTNPDNYAQWPALIYESTPTLGPADAPVTVIMFIDFECPFCQQSYATFKGVAEQYQPVLRIAYKHFPLVSIHPRALIAGEAATCAHDQGKFWEFYDILFREKVFTEAALSSYATDLGLDINRFNTCLKTNRHTPTLETDLQDGIAAGVRGTPTYFVNGRKVEGVITREEWNTILLEALEQ